MTNPNPDTPPAKPFKSKYWKFTNPMFGVTNVPVGSGTVLAARGAARLKVKSNVTIQTTLETTLCSRIVVSSRLDLATMILPAKPAKRQVPPPSRQGRWACAVITARRDAEHGTPKQSSTQYFWWQVKRWAATRGRGRPLYAPTPTHQQRLTNLKPSMTSRCLALFSPLTTHCQQAKPESPSALTRSLRSSSFKEGRCSRIATPRGGLTHGERTAT